MHFELTSSVMYPNVAIDVVIQVVACSEQRRTSREAGVRVCSDNLNAQTLQLNEFCPALAGGIVNALLC